MVFSLWPWLSPLPRDPLPSVSSAAPVFAGDVVLHQEWGLNHSLPPLQSCFRWWDGASPIRCFAELGQEVAACCMILQSSCCPPPAAPISLTIAQIRGQISEVLRDGQTLSRLKRYQSSKSLT